MKRDRTRYAVPTKRAAYLMRKAVKAGVTIYDVTLGENKTAFSVERGGERALEAILTAERIERNRVRERTGKRILSFLKARPVFAAATVLSVMAFSFFQCFVYRTEISGNRFVNTKTIAAVLEAHKIDGFTFKGQVDVPSIRSDVSALDGVSFASVRIKGNRLLVEIKEELPSSDTEKESFEPVRARLSAVITKIVAESGTPFVKIGDKVKKGDVLIAPVYTFTEGEGLAPAKGEVYGVTTYKKEIVLPEISVQNERTGIKQAVRSLFVFGKEIGEEKAPPFSSYDLSEKVVFEALGGSVRVVERTYYERRDAVVFHDFDLELPALIEKETQNLLSSVPFYAVTTGGVTVEQKKMDNILYIVLYYTVEQRLDSLFAPE